MRPWVPIALIAAAGLGVSPVAGQQTGPQSPAQLADAAVSGVVIDGATKQPIPDALVELWWPQQRQYPQIQVRKLTDSRGRFLFLNLPAGDGYTVHATRAGYFDGAFGRDDPDAGAGARVELSAGEWYANATIRLWAPGSVSGTVTDERGEPVVNVFVQVLAEVRRGGAVHLAASEFTTTDDRGMYRIGLLTPGRYYVVVPSVTASAPLAMGAPELRAMSPEAAAALRASGRSLGSYDPPLVDAGSATRLALLGYPVPPPPSEGRAYPITFAGGTALAQASIIEVAAGTERANADVQLVPVATGRITGMVEGPIDARANCVLRLLPSGLEDLGLGNEAATTVTASDGTFTFANVPAGSYTIDVPVRVNSYVAGASDLWGLRPPNPPGVAGMGSINSRLIGSPGFGFINRRSPLRNSWARVQVTVPARDVANVTVPLRPAATLGGRIVADSASSLDLPADAGRYIELESATANVWQGRTGPSRTALPPGEFMVEGIVPGAYLLRSSNAAWKLKSVLINGRDYAHKPIDISSDRGYSGVVVTLTNVTTTITGSVSAQAGAVPATTAVIAFPVEPEDWINYGIEPSRIASTRTSSTGQFRFPALPAGNYYVIAVPAASANAWTNPEFFKRAQPTATRVTIAWGESRSVALRVVDIR